jgi:hypothetical protein
MNGERTAMPRVKSPNAPHARPSCARRHAEWVLVGIVGGMKPPIQFPDEADKLYQKPERCRQ